MIKGMRKKREEDYSRSAKTDRGAPFRKQQEEDERRFRDALEDDEVREALKLLHARDEECTRKKEEENGSQSAKTGREALLLKQQEERRFRDAWSMTKFGKY